MRIGQLQGLGEQIQYQAQTPLRKTTALSGGFVFDQRTIRLGTTLKAAHP